MKKFEAKTLELAYELASSNLETSITNLEIEIIQHPSKGFLGFGSKNAVIVARTKDSCSYNQNKKEPKLRKKEIKIEDVSHKILEKSQTPEYIPTEEKQTITHDFRNDPKFEQNEDIFGKFYSKQDEIKTIDKIKIKKDDNIIITEIKEGINQLFETSCFAIDSINVSMYDDETVYIEFNGADSALLIGKEGYRYKALSYILFNWIQEKYGLMLRLEVAEFLKNQELAIHTYLEPLVENIKEVGYGKTKYLDGILVHIALKKLREEFPDKYVAVKTSPKGDKFVIVNEHRTSK
ncbi:Jag N-terminal domain-containing protein [Arcobacter sp. FWKO B]|uniref:Jag N-terminal domain-containing protein n=1 Tax=Arcobacter sp. FWKO B TaxID=2593672 RepID=UPI0018A5C964|nr:Jag N-terminal domain-containing protein [Arcobacter sp. FWKO B]QOG12806.1 protein jag [Arcobacter sp. FWKO B]